mmetsp:Transcript_29117/g.50003  ORF Transcript_29117/g.50003 Transcript_29117/m.50003 type:complete len:97 (+) Transcript_29117:866-1156(+)
MDFGDNNHGGISNIRTSSFKFGNSRTNANFVIPLFRLCTINHANSKIEGREYSFVCLALQSGCPKSNQRKHRMLTCLRAERAQCTFSKDQEYTQTN